MSLAFCNQYVMMIAIPDAGMLDYDAVVRPIEAQAEDLLAVHSKSYLNNLKVGHCLNYLIILLLTFTLSFYALCLFIDYHAHQ